MSTSKGQREFFNMGFSVAKITYYQRKENFNPE